VKVKLNLLFLKNKYNMLQDPFNVNRYINKLDYFDKLHLGFLRDFFLKQLINKHDSLDLSASINADDFHSIKNSRPVLLIGNATSKKNYSLIIDSFEGDVIRFNRFKVGHQYKLGEKVTHWAIAKNFAIDKSLHKNELEDSILNNSQKSKLDIFVASYPMIDALSVENIKILDTTECFKIFRKMCLLYVKLNGFIFPYEDSYIDAHGAFKPSTGMIVILNSILSYENVKIINFDSFSSKHYWKESSKAKNIQYKKNNNVIGQHQPLIELSILNTLEKMKLISRIT
jgi:hypothetical protein